MFVVFVVAREQLIRVAGSRSLADMIFRGDDRLEIHVCAVTTRQELHDLLFEAFQFPDYYGSNWDAFDECIRDVQVPSVIQIKHMNMLRSRLPKEADLLSDCLRRFALDHEPQITVHFS
jgi:ribonuclease inhibitor